jgi:hypothetical protein
MTTSQPHNHSEVARLMRQITEEYEATQRLLSGVAITATHEFITARMENIGRCHEQLKLLVGEPSAIALGAESLEGANI